MPHLPTPRKRQDGAVLLIGMILMLILMVGAVSLMNGTTLDERLAGNSKASAEAFYAAEAGQLEAWQYLTEDKSEGYKNWLGLHKKVSNLPDEGNENSVLVPVSRTDESIQFRVVAQKIYDSDGNPVDDRFRLKSFGQSGKATRVIVMDLDGSPIPPGVKNPLAPAAISCFGARCTLSPGSAKKKSVVDGRNHKIPKDRDCTGSGCWQDPDGWDDAKREYKDPSDAVSVPAVYLGGNENYSDAQDVRNASDLQTSGQNNTPYIGQSHRHSSDEEGDNPQSSIAFGGNSQAASVWTDDNFPDDDNGDSTAPKYEDYFGESPSEMMADIYDTAKKELDAGTATQLGSVSEPKVTVLDAADTRHKLGVNSAGVLIVNGDGQPRTQGKKKIYESVSFSGTGFYAGLVILRNCSQINLGGNVTIYGAIMVDARDSNGDDCGDEYNPFAGNGQPDVKYSTDALNNTGFGAGNGTGSNSGISEKRDWYEILHQ
ncbi:pilus assembly PilX family protein [Marinobacterium weihaiense]|uniref:Pilus assembly PilX N-terminal domain-containing protein n=1 Tax=Marinobacterium weihaiense TaxID=2851016 RepID=A0ABS6M9N8_9GAMM|nr:pilus assembly PilX N-terminal domain-containing protein [Marinobacterium weihaiense]MBV0932998.1 pilus assembly PilX N-terminal domain-containing protein [Marinobacterium weihaiense]